MKILDCSAELFPIFKMIHNIRSQMRHGYNDVLTPCRTRDLISLSNTWVPSIGIIGLGTLGNSVEIQLFTGFIHLYHA